MIILIYFKIPPLTAEPQAIGDGAFPINPSDSNPSDSNPSHSNARKCKKKTPKTITTYPKNWRPENWQLWLWTGPFAAMCTDGKLQHMTGIYDGTIFFKKNNMGFFLYS